MRIQALFAAIFLLFALAACGGPSADDSQVVSDLKVFMGHLATMSPDIADSISTTEDKQRILDNIAMLRQRQEGVGLNMDLIEMDDSGLEYEVLENDGSTARVRTVGEITLTMAGASRTEHVDKVYTMVLEDSGWKVVME